jgi:hypothetical protein
MRKQILLALLCCLAAAAVGCSGSSPTSSSTCGSCPPSPFETVYEGCDGTYIGGEISGGTYCLVLHSQAELDTFWASQWSDPAPQVNFDNAWVAAVYELPCGGCCGVGTWVVQSAEETPDCISIEIREVGCSPYICFGPAGCACVVLVTVPQADKPICASLIITEDWTMSLSCP